MGKQGIGRRQMLKGMGAGTLGAVAALGTGMTPALAKHSEARVEGSWQAVIHVEQPPDKAVTFPAMFGFARGGLVSRVDGRDNSPSMGTWKHSEAGIIFQRIEYQFLRRGIQPRRWFIQNQNGRVANNCARDCDALALAA